MKISLILIIVLSFSHIGFGQQTLIDSGFTNRAEAMNLIIDSIKEGKWFEYMDSSSRKTTDTNAPYYGLVVFKSGKPSGVARLFYNKSGKLYFEGVFIDGELNGIAKWYYENGKLNTVSFYVKDQINGISKDYYQSGALQYETSYRNDKQNGIEKEYYESGKLKGIYPFKNDKENGIAKEYYESGKLKEKAGILTRTVWKTV